MIPALTFDEFQLYAKQAKYVAVFQEIPAGQLTPLMIYTLLQQRFNTTGVMLEDLQMQAEQRYSYICFDPLATLTLNHDDTRDPLMALRELQAQYQFATRPAVAGLITSAMGFITYDAVRYFEAIPDRHEADPSLPNVLFHFYATSLCFDHAKQTLLISQLVTIDTPLEERYQQAQQAMTGIIQHLTTATLTDQPFPAQTASSCVTTDIADGDFIEKVNQAKDYIVRGDAFQIVLSRCFKREYTVTPLTIYQTLRELSPAPFMFYFPTPASVIMGASPERFIRVHHQHITVNPIAGTRKRTGDTSDELLAADLLNDQKELAEHMMLVDLARNDVGAVSEPATVQVSELLQVKHYSHVSHMTSTVTGKLQSPYDVFDAFAAAFPAGTLSGAPKIRAMQIIDELETSRRGLYGGAICRLDALGNLESCIAIRMAILQAGIATIRTGAGIVYDSNPAHEAQETHHKAQAMLAAIAAAHGE